MHDCAKSLDGFLKRRYEIPGSKPPKIVIPGRCADFGNLFSEALKVNNIPHTYIAVESAATYNNRPYLYMMIKEWSYNEIGTYPEDTKAKWQLRLEGGVMVPEQESYGDFKSLPGISGQNSPTPSEKFFDNHAIIGIQTIEGDKYFDPSYGQTYENEFSFEKDAISGYASQVGFDNYTSLYQVKKPEGKGEIKFNILRYKSFP